MLKILEPLKLLKNILSQLRFENFPTLRKDLTRALFSLVECKTEDALGTVI